MKKFMKDERMRYEMYEMSAGKKDYCNLIFAVITIWPVAIHFAL